MEFVALRAAINNEKNKFREKVRERNTRFTWFDKLSTSMGESGCYYYPYHRVLILFSTRYKKNELFKNSVIAMPQHD